MRVLVFLLLLANLLFFAYSEGYFGRTQHPDALRLSKQVRPEDIRVVARDTPPTSPSKTTAPEATPPQVSTATADIQPSLPETAPATEVCLRWEGLLPKEANPVLALLSERFSDFKSTRQSKPIPVTTWWVFIPPLPGKAEADKKAGELKQLGVQDFLIIQDNGSNHHAISLGIFSSEAAGKTRLAELREKGVRSARLEPGPRKETVQLDVRGPRIRHQELASALSTLGVIKPQTLTPCP